MDTKQIDSIVKMDEGKMPMNFQIGRSKKARVLESALNPKKGFIFIPPSYRKQYNRFYNKRFINYMRMVSFLSVVLFGGSFFIDKLFLPEPRFVMIVRFVFVLPIISFIAIFSLTRNFFKIAQPMIITGATVLITGILVILYYVPFPNKYFHIASLIIIQTFLFTLARIRYKYAVILALYIWIGCDVALVLSPTYRLQIIERNYLFMASTICGIFTGFLLEQTTRRNFLQESLLKLEKKYLSFINRRLQSIAILDSLTNIPNHRYFITTLNKEWSRATRFKYPLVLLMIDIDSFKKINDQYGHLIGDICLQQLALCVKNVTQRPGDIAARYGGDEFVVLLIDTKKEGAEKIVQKIHADVDRLKIYSDSENRELVKFKVSIGISELQPTVDNKPRELISLADKDLYQAKKSKYRF